LRFTEHLLANLAAGGIIGDDAVHATQLMLIHTLGYEVFELPPDRIRVSRKTNLAIAKQMRVEAAERGFTLVQAHATQLATISSRMSFERTLRILLLGIVAESR